MAARPISYGGQPPPPGGPPLRPGSMMYPSQPQPQPLYRPQTPQQQHYQGRPMSATQPHYVQQQHQQQHARPIYSTPQQPPFLTAHHMQQFQQSSPRPQFIQPHQQPLHQQPRPGMPLVGGGGGGGGLMVAPSLPSMPVPQPQQQQQQQQQQAMLQQQMQLQQQRLQQFQQPSPFSHNILNNTNAIVSSASSAAMLATTGVGGAPFVLRTPSLGAAPSVNLAGGPGVIAGGGGGVIGGVRPVIMRPPGVFTAGPPTVISTPGLARIPVPMPMRPVLIAAGPPSIIKKPSRTKALLERPVPVINIKQKTHTLLSDFWSEGTDVTKDGRVIDRSALQDPSKSPNGATAGGVATTAAAAAAAGAGTGSEGVNGTGAAGEKRQRSPRQTGIVVGIDFGNTFTGVSYAHQGDGEMIDVVKWPRHLNAYAKVPTVSLYKTNENKAFVDWGSSALAAYKRSKTDRVLIRDYKLLLFDQHARGRLDHGFHVTDVLTQYLQSIHRHLMEEVNKSQVLAAESVPIHYCITVPQAWTLPTRELMLRCYVEAGIILQTPAPNMTVITEAEAAATYCREKCDEFEQLKDGDIFMICDAGGLSTTVTVFRVDDALGVRQFVRMSSSHAENCGSVMLDRRFRTMLQERLGAIMDLEDETKPTRLKAFETLLEGFREIKSQFDGNSREEVKHLSVPMGLDVKDMDPPPSWMEDEYMSLKGEELCEKVFDPVVEMVLELVNAQSKVHLACAGLFMVGGFGANKYLLHKLQLAAEKNRDPDVGNTTSNRNSLASNGRLSTSMEELRLNTDSGHGESSSLSSCPGVIQKVVMVQKAELAVARGAVIYGLKSASQYTKAFL